MVKQARDELLDAVLEGGVPRARVDELVDTLIAARVPFKESMLGGGPWEVGLPTLTQIRARDWVAHVTT